MTGEERDSKEGKTKSEGPCPTEHMMFEMMKKCCTGEGASSDCAAMMKRKMGAMTSMPCCGAVIGKTKPERSKK